jgi:hypothetical protein
VGPPWAVRVASEIGLFLIELVALIHLRVPDSCSLYIGHQAASSGPTKYIYNLQSYE